MFNRLINALRYIKGNGILLTVKHDTLEVHAENVNKDQIKNIATKFFKQAYTLGE